MKLTKHLIKYDRDILITKNPHINSQNIIDFQKDYLSYMTGTQLRIKYHINKYGFSLAKCHYFFSLKSTKKLCPNCNNQLNILGEARLDVDCEMKNVLFCNTCGHEETMICTCDYCTSIKKCELLMKQDDDRLFIEKHLYEHKVISIKELSFADKIYLGTLIQAGIEDDFVTLKPISSSYPVIFPSEDVLYEVIKDFKSRGILNISASSPVSSFTIKREEEELYYSWKNVNFKINIEEFLENKQFIISNFLNNHEWIQEKDCKDTRVWDTIVYWEALALFNNALNIFKIKYTAGKETLEFFASVTKQFSLATVYSIIYQAAKNVAAYKNTERCPQYVAYNSILQNMRLMRDKLISGQYKPWEYQRPNKYCPQSLVSQYYFNTILKLCDSYWTMLPSDYF